ncbi:hypothetical protein [Flavobacterium sp.]|uniref:hypothetical protein n=1 Tax=Flavobacterium sp. TaxID=239 RepID=UPI002625672B|nr:hypothetical protein [Flavobacterium sp.]
MRYFLVLLLILLSSCRYKHFSFNEVYHYKVALSDKALDKILASDSKTQDEAMLETLLIEDEPAQINATVIQNIQKLYLVNKKLDSSHVAKMSEIYYDGYNFTKTRCVPVYRDILVFKKNDSIVGLSKICFECEQQYTIDSYGQQLEFDNSNFEELKRILN